MTQTISIGDGKIARPYLRHEINRLTRKQLSQALLRETRVTKNDMVDLLMAKRGAS